MEMKAIARFGAVALGLIVAGCSAGGGHGGMESSGHSQMKMAGDHGTGGHEEFSFGGPGEASMVTRTITVTMEDNLFDLEEIAVKEGETVRFVLVNKDDADHEFTLGTPEMQVEHRAEMMKMMDSGMNMDMDHGDANALSVPGGETGEMIWTFGGPATIEFACNIPGHWEGGMGGKLIIGH